MPKAVTEEKSGRWVPFSCPPEGGGGEVGGSGDEGEGKSQEPRAGNEGANEQVPEGKSEGGARGM